jgi:hypothetical protein
MIARCTNPYSVSYATYGAKGVMVCERWTKFRNFLEDMGERPPGTSLDRIDNAKGYEPGNCRWASRSQQNANRGTFRRGKVRKEVIIPKSPRSRGRPKIADPATSRINVRVTPGEREAYKAKAKRARAPSLSAWLKGLAERE